MRVERFSGNKPCTYSFIFFINISHNLPLPT
jgi:hypothetical protein